MCITKVVPERLQDGDPRGVVQRLAIEEKIDIQSTSSATGYPHIPIGQRFDEGVIILRTPPGGALDIHFRRNFELQFLGI